MKVAKLVLLGIILLFLVHPISAQKSQLIAPETWRTEEISLPLTFAPSIPITGRESVRFAPGWGKTEHEEFFTYAFAWFLDEEKGYDKEELEQYLIAYFDGIMKLVGGYTEVGTTVQMNQSDDKFHGLVTTKDAFFTKSEIKLLFSIEKLDQGRIWLFRFSPKSMDHETWKALNEQVRIVN